MSFKAGSMDRLIFTVTPYLGGWAIEHEGVYSDASRSKEEVKAAANKRARAAQDSGRACQVRVSGENGFYRDIKSAAQARTA